MTHRPAFMAITSTGGYIGRIFWNNSGIHPDFPRWGEIHFIPNPMLHCPFGVWAGLFGVVAQITNWRFYDND
jgi:hypothetical protein